jgi:hypothetical protein
MYLFYIDESGTRDPDVGALVNGTPAKDWIYVLIAIGIFDAPLEGILSGSRQAQA